MKSYKKIGFIGFGNMGKALGLGLIANGYEVLYNDLEDKNLDEVKFSKIDQVLNECYYIVLAIKPYQYEEFLKNHNLENNIVISIAAGITSMFMERHCSKYILTMPNTPAFLKLGFSAIVKNDSITNEEFEQVKKMFESVGIAKEVDEDQLSHYICLSGSSPAYFFNFIDSLSSSMTELGIDKNEAEKVFAYVMKASAEMILNSEDNAATLCNNVCSPNGTTIQAVDTFKNQELERICTEAITKCFNRANEMKIK